MGKRLITLEDIEKAAAAGETAILAPPGETIITPMARERADDLGIVIGNTPDAGSAEEKTGVGIQPSQSDLVVREVCRLMRDKLPSGMDSLDLERLVREKVAARLQASTTGPGTRETDACRAQGLCLIDGQRLMSSGGGLIPVDEKVLVAEAIDCGGGSKLAGGYMVWENASFSRTVELPEIGIVIEGELHLTAGGKTLVGKPGDMIYFPSGAVVVYAAPSKVKLACVNCI